jgi:hypothetical protein
MLDGFYSLLKDNTASNYIDYCATTNSQIKYTLVGLMSGNMCFCATKANLSGKPAGGCNAPCVGSSTLTFGGAMDTEVCQLNESLFKREVVVKREVETRPWLFGRKTRM